jgi:hypothetical protein
MALFYVSQSKCNTYRRCKYAYFLRYIEKLRKRLKGRSLSFGSVAHELLEADANGDDPMEKLGELANSTEKMFKSEREDYEDMIQDAEDIMADYFKVDWKDKSLKFIRRKAKSAEHEFEVDLVNGIVLEGKLDAMAKTPDKRTWLVENKTFNKMPNDDHRWRNLQSNVYVRVTEMLGLPQIDGLCWNYIRNQPLGVPRLLKNGTFGLRRVNTLPTRLERFFQENKLKARDYPKIVKAAEDNRRTYFARIFSSAKKATVDRIFKDLIETASEMADSHGKLMAKTIDRHCEWCDYEALCRAELQGGDVDFLKKKEYYVSEHKRPKKR